MHYGESLLELHQGIDEGQASTAESSHLTRDLIDPKLIPPKDTTIILCGMWSLWMARNSRRHDQAPVPLRAVIQWAADTAFDLWQIVHAGKGKTDSRPAAVWERSATRWIKCNIDAAF